MTKKQSPIPGLPVREWKALLRKYAAMPKPKPVRGRPHASRSDDLQTKQSYEAYVFVQREMRGYRIKFETAVPAKVTNFLIDRARQIYPAAKPRFVRRHISRKTDHEMWSEENWSIFFGNVL